MRLERWGHHLLPRSSPSVRGAIVAMGDQKPSTRYLPRLRVRLQNLRCFQVVKSLTSLYNKMHNFDQQIWRFPNFETQPSWDAGDNANSSVLIYIAWFISFLHANNRSRISKLKVCWGQPFKFPFPKPAKNIVFFLKVGGFGCHGVAFSLCVLCVFGRGESQELKQVATTNNSRSIKVKLCSLDPAHLATKNYLSTGWWLAILELAYQQLERLFTLNQPRVTESLKAILRCHGFCTQKSRWNRGGSAWKSIEVGTLHEALSKCITFVYSKFLVCFWTFCLLLRGP